MATKFGRVRWRSRVFDWGSYLASALSLTLILMSDFHTPLATEFFHCHLGFLHKPRTNRDASHRWRKKSTLTSGGCHCKPDPGCLVADGNGATLASRSQASQPCIIQTPKTTTQLGAVAASKGPPSMGRPKALLMS
jgi:hypothetical protein